MSSSAAVSASLFYCGKCGEPYPPEVFNTGALYACGHCQVVYQAHVFPSIQRKWEVHSGDAVQGEQDASCFYHASKRAVTVCEGCGVFLCSLCDVDLKDQHLCPKCIEKGKTKGKIRDLERHRVLYDDLALSLTIYPLLGFWTSLIGAPVALFLVIRHWNSPRSIVPRTRVRFILAAILAVAEMVGWVFFLGYLFTRH